jgi:hypothetical protein
MASGMSTSLSLPCSFRLVFAISACNQSDMTNRGPQPVDFSARERGQTKVKGNAGSVYITLQCQSWADKAAGRYTQMAGAPNPAVFAIAQMKQLETITWEAPKA